ncbi:MAG: CoA transferase, partial [Ramlibacter sp.]|nr:CoA transferase [Ramlibacter sp.]
QDRQALENGYVVDIEQADAGAVKMVGSPITFSATPIKVEGQAPQFGQHTEEVLLDVCGLDWDRIQELRDKQVI